MFLYIYEYLTCFAVPLLSAGPFTSKNCCTSISPWVVSLDALEPFRCSTSAGNEQNNPVPLPYLIDPNYHLSAYDIPLRVELCPQGDSAPSTVCDSNLRNLYWNFKQQLVHHSVTGCNMRPGDLLGSGTISGTPANSFGSMLELSWRGSKDVPLVNSVQADGTAVTRKFLQNGDDVIISGCTAVCAEGYRIGFGECRGRLLAAGTVPSEVHTSQVASSHPASGYSDFKLYSYWRSSSSWRVRTALAIKGVAYETVPVDLLQLVGNNEKTLPDSYVHLVNPAAQVPTLEFKDAAGNSHRLTQSLAIIEFLDEIFPYNFILPRDPIVKARARQV